jgi:hypothetical protein
MSKKIMLGAAAVVACTVAGYIACDAEDGVGVDEGTSELTVLVKPRVEFPLRDNPATKPSQILLVVGGVSAHHVEHGWLDIWATATIDLLAPEEAIPMILDAARMPMGMYDELRFDVVYAGVEIDRKWYPLEIPSEDKSGLKVHTGFCLVDGEAASLELDWNVDEALHYNEKRGYWLEPSLESFSPPTCADDLRTPPRS